MKRVVVIGIGGKSTLATNLGKLTGLPVYHLDKYYWLPNWVERDRAEMKKMVDEIVSKDKWIIEGNFGMKDSWIEKRLTKADTIIFLNLPFRIVFRRLIRRIWKYRGKTRPDMTEGNVEKLVWGYIKYLKNFDRQKVLKLIDKHQKNKQVFIFNQAREARKFLALL